MVYEFRPVWWTLDHNLYLITRTRIMQIYSRFCCWQIAYQSVLITEFPLRPFRFGARHFILFFERSLEKYSHLINKESIIDHLLDGSAV